MASAQIRLFALTIAINDYQHINKLNGAVVDADEFENYLRSYLGVPPERIISIRDSSATRDAILGAIKNLAHNSSIQKDDPILIFFAGHGGRALKPLGLDWDHWMPLESKIELICPVDMGDPGVGGQCGIPDRSVAALLDRISDEKGNNITLIFDCCHSGGINRSFSLHESDAQPRICDFTPAIEPACDMAIWGPRLSSARISSAFAGFENRGRSSHVLLAACRRDELAWEKEGRGLFTRRLISLLREVDIARTDYASLIYKMGDISRGVIQGQTQTPICDGLHINRRLFSSEVVPGHRSLISGHIDNGNFILRAGAAHGVAIGDSVDIYAENHALRDKIATLVVSEITASFSMLTLCGEIDGSCIIPEHFYGKALARPDRDVLSVYCSEEATLKVLVMPLFPNYKISSFETAGIYLTHEIDSADLIVAMTSSGIIYNMQLKAACIGDLRPQVAPRTIPVKSAQLLDVLLSALEFKRHLNREGEVGSKDEEALLDLHFHRLKPIGNGRFKDSLIPSGPNLLNNKVTTLELPNTGTETCKDGPFGITVFNKTRVPLYPYLFAFEGSDLSITPWYLPPFGQGGANVGAPLAPSSQMHFGFGESGCPPWGFRLDPTTQSDVTIFKLFVTSAPSDFSSVAQESPLSPRNGTSRKAQAYVTDVFPDVWGSVTAMIVQERAVREA
ncbi:hypothetical protein SISSUDRAFT_684576 [Sistotremastrum suecicum HHB10207 ss-3]|uniref:Peptidase C14 caspase domain-containing protein n=1 Tax=Sistotremastrum suecicum HHB10207 ss-3 TaxID=1314776 RepID=A0A166I1L3_9AGAM|nr:hypothetical protein SISSUDRAFT_684576 [Sistotremastrum suecicum HHB10207 ss-3]